jgi:hypothetical protein
MAAAAVRVRGLREAIGAFRAVDRALAKDFRQELKEAAEPVASAARSKLGRYRGVSMAVSPRLQGGSGVGVVVRQNARKVTGRRGDFGGLQMRRAFEPALDEHADEVVDRVDAALGRWINKAGL